MKPLLQGALAILISAIPSLAAATTSEVTATSAQKHLLVSAQSALDAGQPARAIKLFEQIESGGESVEAEVGLVRAHLQAGEMRAATAFANLVAGEHPDSGAAVGVLAYVEDRLGYTEKALSRLEVARKKSPADVALLTATVEILQDHGATARARGLLQEWIAANGDDPHVPGLQRRLASAGDGTVDVTLPDAWTAAYSEETRIGAHGATHVANGFVIDGGTTVVTHASVAAKSRGTIVVRNGLGLVRTARVKEARPLAPGLVALVLTTPFPKSASLDRNDVADVSQARFCFTLGFQAIDAGRFSYPVVAPGMIFRASAGNERLLQVSTAFTRDQIGSPLFDDRGHLLGIAIGNQSAAATAGYAVTDLGTGNFGLRIDGLGTTKAPAAVSLTSPRSAPMPKPAIEELYERIAPAVVQIFVE